MQSGTGYKALGLEYRQRIGRVAATFNCELEDVAGEIWGYRVGLLGDLSQEQGFKEAKAVVKKMEDEVTARRRRRILLALAARGASSNESQRFWPRGLKLWRRR
jgi:cyclophilin family peptidyl-prolyl cis-trans isomerase